MTNDTVLLNNGLVGIEADGETSLYDSLIYGLYYLTGLREPEAALKKYQGPPPDWTIGDLAELEPLLEAR